MNADSNLHFGLIGRCCHSVQISFPAFMWTTFFFFLKVIFVHKRILCFWWHGWVLWINMVALKMVATVFPAPSACRPNWSKCSHHFIIALSFCFFLQMHFCLFVFFFRLQCVTVSTWCLRGWKRCMGKCWSVVPWATSPSVGISLGCFQCVCVCVCVPACVCVCVCTCVCVCVYPCVYHCVCVDTLVYVRKRESEWDWHCKSPWTFQLFKCFHEIVHSNSRPEWFDRDGTGGHPVMWWWCVERCVHLLDTPCAPLASLVAGQAESGSRTVPW